MNQMKNRLLEIMAYRNMTISELSNASGLSIETVKNLVYGRVNDPRLSTLLPICDALNCSLDYLLGRGRIALQQARDFSNHSIKLVEKIIDIEYKLSYAPISDGKQLRSIIMPNHIIKDVVSYDSCGLGYIDVTHILSRNPRENITCGILLRGDHLSPIYFDKDILLVNCERIPEIGEIGIWICDQKLYIRRYLFSDEFGGILQPLLRHGTPLHSKSLSPNCFGTVLGVYRGNPSFLDNNDPALINNLSPNHYS